MRVERAERAKGTEREVRGERGVRLGTGERAEEVKIAKTYRY
jgi:hypothetical protein